MPESEIVFDVNECSPVLDSYSVVDAMSNKEDLLSLNPTLFGSIPKEVGSYLAWTVENLEGSKWNRFALQTSEDVESLGFSIYALGGRRVRECAGADGPADARQRAQRVGHAARHCGLHAVPLRD